MSYRQLTNFSSYLEENYSLEWESKYLHYDKLQNCLVDINEYIDTVIGFKLYRSSTSLTKETLLSNCKGDIEFFRLLYEDIDRVEAFYLEQLKKAETNMESIVYFVAEYENNYKTKSQKKKKKKSFEKKLKESLLINSRLIDLIYNYSVMNHTGFTKLASKYDKQTGLKKKKAIITFIDEKCTFPNLDVIHRLENELVKIYAHYFGGSLKDIKTKLRRLNNESVTQSQQIFSRQFFSGMLAGISSIAMITCVVLFFLNQNNFMGLDLSYFKISFSYHCVIVFILFLWFINTKIWEFFKVNFVFICMFEPSHSSSFGIFNYLLINLFGFSMLLNLYFVDFITFTQLCDIYYWGLFSATVFVGVFPIGERHLLTKTIVRCLVAPFKTVLFRDFYFADQLTSASYFMNVIFEFFLHFLKIWDLDAFNTLSTFLMIFSKVFPFWCRLFQCLKRYQDSKDEHHLHNLGKYACALISMVLSLCNDKWGVSVAFHFISMLYSLYWDLFVDWGLFLNGGFLCRRTLYPNTFYYFGIILDIVLRTIWIPITQLNWKSVGFDYLGAFRRGYWNILRMENEQVSNIGKFRIVQEVPIPDANYKRNKKSKIRKMIIDNIDSKIEKEKEQKKRKYRNDDDTEDFDTLTNFSDDRRLSIDIDLIM
eukprot:TRINITY_DN965_c0_g1_i1.p1 TRINITY_DN965_c0_g1~~TRINITY_DN965_c0_g1_i1.p1  ORF type:complete len:651 (-),score=106.30 TRINITY_DN965_c0_g1_i1:258-2210(-)